MAATLAGLIVSWTLSNFVGGLGVLTAAIAVGIAARNTVEYISATMTAILPGTRFVSRYIFKAGVVLLGFRLSLTELARLGGKGTVAVLAVVILSFFITKFLARLAGLPPATRTLLAAGYAVCGVSAVAAVSGVVRHDDDDLAAAVAMVTVCGTLAVFLLPPLALNLGMDPVSFGAWVGASVHDVGQVLAAAGAVGDLALDQAVVVKLTRVLTLVPMVLALGLTADRQAEAQRAPRPWFIGGFIVAAGLSTVLDLPSQVLVAASLASQTFLAAGLFVAGLGVSIRHLARARSRVLATGISAWLILSGLTWAIASAGLLG